MRRYLLLLLFAIQTFPLVHATVLHADGLIRVKGAGWKGTRVTVVPEFSQPYDVDLRSTRFMLHLPLQSTYLVRAERANCPTKEVIFDLRMPMAAMHIEYEFPFEILLEVQPEGVELRYAGPVGLVSFDTAKGDFSYITDHRLVAIKGKADELRDRLAPEHMRSRNTMVEPVVRLPSATPLGPSAPLVAHDATIADIAKAEATVEMDVREEVSPENTTDITVAPAVVENHLAAEALEPKEHPVPILLERPARAISRSVTTSPAMVAAEPKPCGTNDMTVNDRMVITTRRVPTPDGGCQELRTVTHAYGAVFHFHDGRPVTEAYFRKLLTTR